MPFCGYDPLMGRGVAQFAEGLIASMKAKARERLLDLDQQLAEEAVELERLVAELSVSSAASEEEREEPLLGIVLLVRHLMQPKDAYGNSREDFEGAVRERARHLDERMQVFERAFYGAPALMRLDAKIRLAVEASRELYQAA